MNGHIYVENPEGRRSEITEGVQALYDLVIQSMDWGSGFLTIEDAVPIAELAELCGFDGMREAQRYLVEKRRDDRASDLHRAWRSTHSVTSMPNEVWREAYERACREIGCQAVNKEFRGGGHCQLPEAHAGPHLNGSVEW